MIIGSCMCLWKPAAAILFHCVLVLPWGLRLTIVRLCWAIVGLVNGGTEALIAAASADHVGSRPMEGQVTLLHLRHGRLEALQRAGLLQAQRGTQLLGRRHLCGKGREAMLVFKKAK